jgi:hypothetical protein
MSSAPLDSKASSMSVPPTTGGRKKTAWMTHVKATMRAHKGMKLMQVLKMAKKTYKKAKRGGGVPGGLTPAPSGSSDGQMGARRRRRGTRRSRRGGMDE